MSIEVDTELERRLEAVLIRHGIPAELGNSDRGDLSSDLAEVSRKYAVEVLLRPLREGSE